MAAFIALKPCRFGTVDYGRGDTIPAEAVNPSRIAALVRAGCIASVPETPTGKQEEIAGQEQTTKPKKPRTVKKQVT